MPEYTARKEGGSWDVIDERGGVVYESLTEFEALTVAEILNSGSDSDWDTVSSDWRWAVLVQINQLADRLDQLA